MLLLLCIALTTFIIFRYSSSYLEFLTLLIVNSLPLSWLSIFGEGGLKVNLYLVCCLALFSYVLFTTINNRHSWLVWCGVLFINVLFALQILLNYESGGIAGVLKSATMLPMFAAFLLVLRATSGSARTPPKLPNVEKSLVILATTGAGVALFISFQAYQFVFGGLEYGYIFMRQGRLSFGAHFFDFTILTAFLILSLVSSLILCARSRSRQVILKYGLVAILIAIAVVLTSSRAGIVAIAIGAVLAVILDARNLAKHPSAALLFIGGCSAISVALFTYLSLSRVSLMEEGFWDSTRTEGWLFWLEQFAAGNVLDWIVGLGQDYYVGSEGKGFRFTSHNLILDALLSGGVLLMVTVLAFLCFISIKMRGVMKILFFTSGLILMLVAPSVMQARIFGLYSLFLIILIADDYGREVNTYN